MSDYRSAPWLHVKHPSGPTATEWFWIFVTVLFTAALATSFLWDLLMHH